MKMRPSIPRIDIERSDYPSEYPSDSEASSCCSVGAQVSSSREYAKAPASSKRAAARSRSNRASSSSSDNDNDNDDDDAANPDNVASSSASATRRERHKKRDGSRRKRKSKSRTPAAKGPKLFEHEGQMMTLENILAVKKWYVKKVLKKSREGWYLCQWRDTMETPELYFALKEIGYGVKIVEQEAEDGVKVIKCKWKPTWEFEQNLTRGAIAAFEAAEDRKREKKDRKREKNDGEWKPKHNLTEGAIAAFDAANKAKRRAKKRRRAKSADQDTKDKREKKKKSPSLVMEMCSRE
mmetsp:Transcript_10535/g.25440  ORF Transcript_10535/g.25440 Transcript_10535/m.25440 type:complete len:295 (-) Transcript_10535:73-957(-)